MADYTEYGDNDKKRVSTESTEEAPRETPGGSPDEISEPGSIPSLDEHSDKRSAKRRQSESLEDPRSTRKVRISRTAPPRNRPPVKDKRFSKIAAATQRANSSTQDVADNRLSMGGLDFTSQLPQERSGLSPLANPSAAAQTANVGYDIARDENKYRKKTQARNTKVPSPGATSGSSPSGSVDYDKLDDSVLQALHELHSQINELETESSFQKAEIEQLEASRNELQSIIDDLNRALNVEMQRDPIVNETLATGVAGPGEHPLSQIGPVGRLVRRLRQMPGFIAGEDDSDTEQSGRDGRTLGSGQGDRLLAAIQEGEEDDDDDGYESYGFDLDDIANNDSDDDDAYDGYEEKEEDKNKGPANNRQSLFARFSNSLLETLAMGPTSAQSKTNEQHKHEHSHKHRHRHRRRHIETGDDGYRTKVTVYRSDLKKKLKTIQEQVEDAHGKKISDLLADREVLANLIEAAGQQRDTAILERDELQQQNDRMRELLQSLKDGMLDGEGDRHDDNGNTETQEGGQEEGQEAAPITQPTPQKSSGPRSSSGCGSESSSPATVIRSPIEEAPATPPRIMSLASQFNSALSGSSSRSRSTSQFPNRQRQQVATAIEDLLKEPSRPSQSLLTVPPRREWHGMFATVGSQTSADFDAPQGVLLGAQDVLVMIWGLARRQKDNLAVALLYAAMRVLTPAWYAVDWQIQHRFLPEKQAVSPKSVQRISEIWRTFCAWLVLQAFPNGTKHLERYLKPTPPFPRDAVVELLVSAFVFLSGFAMYCAIQERSIWLDNNADFPLSYLQTYILQRRQDIDGSINVSSSLFSAAPSSLISQSQARRNPFTTCLCLPTLVDPRFITMPLGGFWDYCTALLYRVGWFLHVIR